MPTLEPTASFGKLFIDERNGYIGLCPTHRYNAKRCQWYSILNVANIGVYCTNPKCDYRYRVTVDCELSFDVPSQGIHIKKIIKQRIFCQHHTYAKNKNYEEWSEPGSISIIRGILTQTYANAVNNELKQWEQRLYYLEICIQEQARCAFMLPRNATENDLETSYQTLKQAFADNPYKLDTIERYYKSLKEQHHEETT